jgi:hypothetical protein
MDMQQPHAFAPAAPDLSPAGLPTLAERVFSEPGRISEAVFVNLDFAEGDMAALAECAAIYGSSTLATIAGRPLAGWAGSGATGCRPRRQLRRARRSQAGHLTFD